MNRPRRKGRPLLLAIAVLWLACLVGLYWMVVKLKLGGEAGIRQTPAQPAAEGASAPASR